MRFEHFAVTLQPFKELGADEHRSPNAREIDGRLFSAIQITTAAGICAMVDLVVEGRLPRAGFVRQEQAVLSEFLANRFGSYFV